MKACRTCGTELPLEQFYRHPQMLDGHLNVCIECVRERVRRHRRLNDSVREYDRQRAKLPHRKDLAKIVNERSRQDGRGAARTKLARAVRAGHIAKEPCYFCGTTEHVHGHHHDYSKPLEVTWLCANCHHRLHALERAGVVGIAAE